jgi:hypothetical protein
MMSLVVLFVLVEYFVVVVGNQSPSESMLEHQSLTLQAVEILGLLSVE